MARLIILVSLAVAGCGDASPTSQTQTPDDPTIRAKDSIGGSLGPAGGGRSREYQGPASKAPDWAKPRKGN